MPFRKIKKRFSHIDIQRDHIIFLFMALACIVTGYLIAIISNAGKEIFNESHAVEKIINNPKNIEALKKSVESKPELLKKVNSIPSKD